MTALRIMLRNASLVCIALAIRTALNACLPEWEEWGAWSEIARAGVNLAGGDAALRSGGIAKTGAWLSARSRLCQMVAKLGKGLKVSSLFDTAD